MSHCLFCDIVHQKLPSEIIYQDDLCVAFNDIHPKAAVHFLLVPHKHISSLAHLQTQDKDLMGHMMLKVPEIAKKQGLNQGFRVAINTGIRGGQEVFHIHFHVMGYP